MAKVKRFSTKINSFFVEWSALNHYLSSYECEKNGVPYIGFKDPRVQKLWNSLSSAEKRDLMKHYGKKNEAERNIKAHGERDHHYSI